MTNLKKNYLKRVVKRLEEGILFIDVNDSEQPYTLNEELIGQSAPEFDIEKSLNVWSVMHKTFEEIDVYHIRGYACCDRDINGDFTTHDESLKIIDAATQACQSVDGDVTTFRDAVNVYFQPKVNPEIFEMLKVFRFAITVDEFIDNDVSEEQLSAIKDTWMSEIRTARDAAFTELDELQEEAVASSEDDAEDVELIKQMFRDIPQEVDLTGYTTLEQIVSYWPSLLLPAPEFITSAREVAKKHHMDSATDDLTPVQELDIILSSITNIGDLEEMLEILDNTLINEENADAGMIAGEKIRQRLTSLQAPTA